MNTDYFVHENFYLYNNNCQAVKITKPIYKTLNDK